MDIHQSDKLDLYSVPVFVLELLLLIGLAFAAHHIHFQYKHEPYLTGFYCDDISIRHEFHESKLTEQFEHNDNELVVLSLLLVMPIVVVSEIRPSTLSATWGPHTGSSLTNAILLTLAKHTTHRLFSVNWSTPCLARSSFAESEHFASAVSCTRSPGEQFASRVPTFLASS